ncbi:biotin--[acetyl-CoA-carboxylase] ligase [Spirosoma endbachense]|uniref:Biotin--[acetyl-CoA-carboxylase] ligase n=1 Tax=Spirosoma endbachense TaxID=2666025 RepID=A0A6P1VYR4_9BACT|nr:biotin--[acetyl-CoA-carboxylase] ligase [Spirosoma endbachense]QHV97242.1 biotin--[acetyl-CoA-carboxylase] ligase [Spirosoma endbachense]
MYKIYPKTLFVGQIVKYLPSCQSTNDEASALIAQQDPAEGLIVVTDNQMAGRGQRGNVWEAKPAQNLTFSLILKPSFLIPAEQFWLNMAISLGIYDTLQPLIGVPLRIKWPNDIYVEDRKLGGILIENSLQGQSIAWSVIGVGLNINQTEFSYSTATSLQQQAPLPDNYDLPGVLNSLCEKIEQRYLQLRSGHRDNLKINYLQTLYRYQEEHSFVNDGRLFRGTIVGVDAVGRLAIAEGEQVRYFGFKEVAFINE